jgi:hypothetical protein
MRSETSAYVYMPSRHARRWPNIMWFVIMADAMVDDPYAMSTSCHCRAATRTKPKNNKPRTLARGHHQHLWMPNRGGVLPQAHSCIGCPETPLG